MKSQKSSILQSLNATWNVSIYRLMYLVVKWSTKWIARMKYISKWVCNKLQIASGVLCWQLKKVHFVVVKGSRCNSKGDAKKIFLLWCLSVPHQLWKSCNCNCVTAQKWDRLLCYLKLGWWKKISLNWRLSCHPASKSCGYYGNHSQLE